MDIITNNKYIHTDIHTHSHLKHMLHAYVNVFYNIINIANAL